MKDLTNCLEDVILSHLPAVDLQLGCIAFRWSGQGEPSTSPQIQASTLDRKGRDGDDQNDRSAILPLIDYAWLISQNGRQNENVDPNDPARRTRNADEVQDSNLQT